MTVTTPLHVRTARLSEAQNWRCCYCGFVMLSPAAIRHEERAVLGAGPKKARRECAKYRRATREHLIPRCDGGSDALENLTAACRWCNEYRGNRPLLEAAARIKRLITRGTHPHQVWEQHRRFQRLHCLPSRARTALVSVEVHA